MWIFFQCLIFIYTISFYLYTYIPTSTLTRDNISFCLWFTYSWHVFDILLLSYVVPIRPILPVKGIHTSYGAILYFFFMDKANTTKYPLLYFLFFFISIEFGLINCTRISSPCQFVRSMIDKFWWSRRIHLLHFLFPRNSWQP